MTYLGINAQTGQQISDMAHIRQSVSDILITPQGSRVMRRAYGSLLSELIDQPQNPALRLKMMAAVYGAVTRWEPRVTLTAINLVTQNNGGMIVELTGTRTDNTAHLNLAIPLRGQ